MLATTLAGCEARRGDVELLFGGPDPNVSAASAAALADNQARVIAQVSRYAGLGDQEPSSAEQWRLFTVAAFDIADAQCEAYISALRRLDIARRQTTRQVNLLGTATSAIMGLAGAAAGAVAATATAFGLAEASVENLAGGLLYQLPPSAVRELVDSLREAYERGLQSANWQDRPAAFRTIRSYVELCLPAVIDSHVTAAVRAARPVAVTAPLGTGASQLAAPPRLRIAALTPAEIEAGRAQARSAVPLPAQLPVPIAGAREDERFLTAPAVRHIQAVLCLPEAQRDGTLLAPTRDAIAQFRDQVPALGRGPGTSLAPAETNRLLGLGTCDTTRFRTAYERALFGLAPQPDGRVLPVTATERQRRVRDVQQKLNAALRAAAKETVPESGELDEATRAGIERLDPVLGRTVTATVLNRIT